jgi:fused signal recognition particle receptor
MGFFSNIKDKIAAFTEKAVESISFKKISDGLEKTRKSFVSSLQSLLGAGRKIDDTLLDEIEAILLTADIGVTTTNKIITSLKQRVKQEKFENSDELFEILKEEILKLLIEENPDNENIYDLQVESKPHVILIVGVNGVGKTTSIGKLSYNYKNANKSVVIGAADTFRAAANEQLEIWAERAGVEIIMQPQGADPAAVAFDTVKSAQAKGKDIVIIDTAGRLHTKGNLMQELEKITRVITKLKPSGPDEVFLVLDATTGQNAIIQAQEFKKVAKLTGIILTKLDGTAKGGVVIPIVDELRIPVKFIGVGEKIDDLQVFNSVEFVEALFAK